MTYITGKEIYDKDGLHCTTHRDFETDGIPIQYCICLKTTNIEEAREKKKKFDQIINPNSKINKALKLQEIVAEIEQRHGLGCDCGFCECLRKGELEDKEKNSHWVLHSGEEYTDGSLINSFETQADAIEALKKVRGGYNITQVEGKWME